MSNKQRGVSTGNVADSAVNAAEAAQRKSRLSTLSKYLMAGVAAAAFGSAMPSCGSSNPDSVINIPPLSSDAGTDTTTSDGGASDGGNCTTTPVCAPQSVPDTTLNVSDSVVYGGYRFKLTGTGESNGDQYATFDVLDACGNTLLSNQTVRRGQTQTFHVQGSDEDIVMTVSTVTVLDPKTATVSATVTCHNDGGVTDGGQTTDSGSGGSDGGAGGDGGAVVDGGDGGSVVDAGSEGGADAGSGGDGGMGGDGGSVVDAGSEGGADAGGSDGGSVSDGGMDGGSVSDGGITSDGGACMAATTGSFSGIVSSGHDVTVGHYLFHFAGLSGSDVLMDISCGGIVDGTGVHCPTGSTTVIDVPADGKQISITVQSATSTYATLTINVANH